MIRALPTVILFKMFGFISRERLAFRNTLTQDGT